MRQPWRHYRNDKNEINDKDCCEKFFAGLILFVWFASLIAWIHVYFDYRNVKNDCNHRVTAYVTAQNRSEVHDKCLLTLRWQDAEGKQRRSVFMGECDSSFGKDASGEQQEKRFPEPLCYRHGDPASLRRMRDGDIENDGTYYYYNRRWGRFHHHGHYASYSSDVGVVSPTTVRDLKRTSVALLVVWTVPLAIVVLAGLSLLCFPALFLCCRNLKTKSLSLTRDTELKGTVPSVPSLEATSHHQQQHQPHMKDSMLPTGFLKSDDQQTRV
jgi:hypothetical protein